MFKINNKDMSNIRFEYNPETFSYKATNERSIKDLVKLIFTQFTAVIMLTVVFFLLLNKYITSPQQYQIERETAEIRMKYNMVKERMREMDKELAEIQKRDDYTYRPFFQEEPLAASVRNAGYGGVDRYKKLEGYENSALVIDAFSDLDKLSKKVVIQSQSHDQIIKKVKDLETFRKSLPAICPIAQNELSRFSSPFGMRFHPIHRRWKMHTGVDLTAPRGTDIHSTGDGKVIKAGWGNGYGHMVVIEHGFSLKTVYSHMSKILVKEGQKIKRGEVLGLVGSSGTATCNHLHYEVRVNDIPKNPLNYYSSTLTKEQFEQVLAAEKNAPLSHD